MVQFKIPQLGFFFRSEANVKFFISFIALLLALYWANRSHRARNAQIKQEEREDKIIIIVSTIVFLIVTVVVYRAFNQFNEALNLRTLQQAMAEPGGAGSVYGMAPGNGTGARGHYRSLTYWERLTLWFQNWRTMREKDYKTLVIETAIYGVVITIIILLCLICYPNTCRSCRKEEAQAAEAAEYHNHPVPEATRNMVLSPSQSSGQHRLETASTVPDIRFTPLGDEDDGPRKRRTGDESRGDNRTPPEDLSAPR